MSNQEIECDDFSLTGKIIMDFSESYPETCSSVGMAARLGDLGCVQELVWHGRPVDVRDNRGWTPIHEAAFHGHPGCLEFLLRHESVDVDWKTFEGETALILAARQGKIECLRTLLDNNADVNAETNESFSPLYEATKANSLDCVRILLCKGADINHQIYTGYTALHVAAEKGLVRILSYLINHGAKIDKAADEGLTPIFLAAQFGHKECLKILLQTAIDKDQMEQINKPVSDNATPLLIAAQEGHESCIRMLLDVGADANIPVSDVHAIAAHFAIYKNKPRCLQLLLPSTKEDALCNTVDVLMHPLLLALQLEDTTCLEILSAAGLDFNCKLPINQDVFDLDDKHLLFNILTYDKNASILCHVGSNWSTKGADVLLKAGLQCDAVSPRELPPLISALVKGAYDLFLLLLQYKCNTNIHHRLVGGNLPVLLALMKDMVNNVFFVEERKRRKVFGKYLIPLLMAGANAQPCFCALLQDNMHEEAGYNLYTVLNHYVWTNIYSLMVLLLCFTCNVTLADTLQSMLFQGEVDEQKKVIKNVEASSWTLAHACRKVVTFSLASNGCYNKNIIMNLPIPSILQEYLLFMDNGTYISEIIQDTMSQFSFPSRSTQSENQAEENNLAGHVPML